MVVPNLEEAERLYLLFSRNNGAPLKQAYNTLARHFEAILNGEVTASLVSPAADSQAKEREKAWLAFLPRIKDRKLSAEAIKCLQDNLDLLLALQRHEQGQGEDSVKLTHALLSLLTPKNWRADPNKLLAILPRFTSGLKSALAAQGVEEQQVQRFLAEMAEIHKTLMKH